MPVPVTMYTTSWCPYCSRARALLKRKSVSFEDIDGPAGEASADVASRVRRARDHGRARGTGSNHLLSGLELRRAAALEPDAQELLGQAMRGLGLSARGHDRLLRVARTIADLAGEGPIGAGHLAEALTYRRCDPDTIV